MVRFSKTVGRNLGPFFEAWGVPTSATAHESIAKLPLWLPKGMKEAIDAQERRQGKTQGWVIDNSDRFLRGELAAKCPAFS